MLDVERYLRDGYQQLPAVLAAPDVRAAREFFHSIEVAGPDTSYEPEFDLDGDRRRLRKLRRLLWNAPGFWAPILVRAGAVEVAEAVVGADARVVFHAAFLKPARIGTPVALHQDQALWRYTYPRAASMWIALSDVHPGNGGLHGCPTSHANGLLAHRDLPEYPWHPALAPDTPGLAPVTQFHLAPGDAVVWDRWFAHGSAANTSAQDRMGMVVVFADGGDPSFRATDSFGLTQIRSLATG